MVSCLRTPSVADPYDVNHEGDSPTGPDELSDDDNIADANLHETLSCYQDPPAPNQAPSTELPPSPPLSPSDPDHSDDNVAVGCETSPIVVELFSSGYAGAPITNDSPSHSDDSTQELPCRNIWAPFHSQCDWEVARWAKMHGTTSSAVTELLAIPEVRMPDKSTV